MDNNDKSILKLHVISWLRSGGNDKVSWDKMETYYKIDPTETRSVIEDTLVYFECQTKEDFQNFTERLHKLS